MSSNDDQVWSLYERAGDGDRSGFTPVEQGVLAICDLCQEVNSGGFDAYFRSWGGDTASIARDMGKQLLGERWFEFVSRAMSIVGEPYPLDPDERALRLDRDGVDDALEDMDREFWVVESELDIYEVLGAELV